MVCLYEDPDLVRGWMMAELESEYEYLPAGLVALLDAYVAAANAARSQKSPRAGRPPVLAAARAAVEKGEFPEPPVIGSSTNMAYQKRLDALRDRAALGVLSFEERIRSIEATEVKGRNTYARIVAGYRDLLLAYLKARQAEGLSSLKGVGAMADEYSACDGCGDSPAGDQTSPAGFGKEA